VLWDGLVSGAGPSITLGRLSGWSEQLQTVIDLNLKAISIGAAPNNAVP